jgi:quinol monooxygenase YgiN
MGAFIQVIEFESSRYDEMQQMIQEMQAARQAEDPDGPGPRRATAAQDRDRPGHYIHMVEFASYEEAMANSQHPETQKFAAKLAELADGPPKFYNLDVLDVMER